MMLLLSSQQIRNADAYTIKHEPIASIDLMERAAQQCADFISGHYDTSIKILICCGPGNNGGDGLAIARLLHQKKYVVNVILAGEKFSLDNLTNQKRCREIGISIGGSEDFKKLDFQNTIIVDAIFGTGLSRKPEGEFAQLINWMNSSGGEIISIDVPSGMMELEHKNNDPIIKATITLTFQFPKIAFLLPDVGIYAGDWKVLDIGLDPEGYLHEKPLAYFVTKEMIQANFPKREIFSHKGKFGHAALIGGSYGKCGAMVLAAGACLKTGAGLTTVMLPECGYEIIQSSLPEVMVQRVDGENYLESILTKDWNFSAIGIGPGMGTSSETALVLKNVIQNAEVPLILDADALNILSENKTWLSFLPSESILTPHIGEFRRLVGNWDSFWEMISLQKDFAFKHQCYVILKGAYTAIATPAGNLYFNSTGNPGLAKGGSGDTLTGILTALKAQGLSSLETCLSGVFLHGLAADIAVQSIHENSLVATDVIQYISEALEEIQD